MVDDGIQVFRLLHPVQVERAAVDRQASSVSSGLDENCHVDPLGFPVESMQE